MFSTYPQVPQDSYCDILEPPALELRDVQRGETAKDFDNVIPLCSVFIGLFKLWRADGAAIDVNLWVGPRSNDTKLGGGRARSNELGKCMLKTSERQEFKSRRHGEDEHRFLSG